MRIVIDASVAVKWVLDEAESQAAVALRDQELLAPALWLAEAANALWRKARAGEITAVEASACLSELRKAPVASLSMEPYLEPALELAVQMGHPVYDCIYLALALQHRTHVVTADRRFVSAASTGAHAGVVRLLTAQIAEEIEVTEPIERALEEIKFGADGLVPAIAQQHDTGEVLMMAWMNRDAVRASLSEGRACYWSRSRAELWRKGETSGQVQYLRELRLDCDGDALLLLVDQTGVACHTGRRSCFFRAWRNTSWAVIAEPQVSPEILYPKRG